MFRLLVPSSCGEGLALLSRLRCSGSRLFYVEHALRCARFQPSVFHKSLEQKAAPAFCAFPVRAAQAARSLTGALSPPWSQPQSPPAPVGCLRPVSCHDPPSRRMSTIQNLRRSLIRNWRPVCSAVGDAVLGAKPAPFPSPLPPAGLGRSAACELFSVLARSLCSADGRQCVQAC